MAPNFVPFTGFSYATGLASLGQGLNRLGESFDRAADRRLLEEWGRNPTLENAARTGNPALVGLAFKDQEKRRTEALTAQATRDGLSALGGLGGGLGGGSGSAGGIGAGGAGAASSPASGSSSSIQGSRIGDVTPDEDIAIRTAMGEAMGEGPQGWRWVAGVLANRAKGSGGSLRDVALAPSQFEPWSSRRAELEGYDPNSNRYRAVASAILPILRGQEADPTGGATHFYAPKAQAALGRRPPSWDDGSGTDIGNHRFFRLGYNGQGRHGIPAAGGAPQMPGGGMQVASAAPFVPQATSRPQSGMPPTPEEIRAGQADGTFPPGAVPEFIVQQYQREPVYRQMVDQWRAQRGGQPTQVAAATSHQDAAAADAARVQAQGGPRMVLSPGSPLTQGGVTSIAPYAASAPPVDPGIPPPAANITGIAPYAQGGSRPPLSAQRIAAAGTSAPAPFVPPSPVINVPRNASEDDITQAEIASGMRTPEGGFLPAGALSATDAAASTQAAQGTPLPYRQPAQPGAGSVGAPAAQPQARSPNAPNWQTVDQVPQPLQDSVARERDIAKLSKVMANPYTPEGLREVAKMRLQALLNSNDKMTEPVKTYLWAKANNEHGGLSFQEFTDRNKKDDPGAKLKAETAAREAEAGRMGLDPRSADGQRYVLTGQLPAPKERQISGADRKAIFDAEDQLPMLDQTIETLQRARELNRQTYTGTSAAARGWLGTSLPDGLVPDIVANPKTAAATREFGNIMSMEAIRSMSESLKGATTDREMSRFMEILGDPSTPPDIRERTIDRITTLAQRQRKIAEDRIRDLRGGDYFKPGRGQDGPPRSEGSPSQARGGNRPSAQERFDQLTQNGATKVDAYRQMAQEGY